MSWFRQEHESKETAIREVRESAAPVLAKLEKVREEHRRIDAQIERELRLIRGV